MGSAWPSREVTKSMPTEAPDWPRAPSCARGEGRLKILTRWLFPIRKYGDIRIRRKGQHQLVPTRHGLFFRGRSRHFFQTTVALRPEKVDPGARVAFCYVHVAVRLQYSTLRTRHANANLLQVGNLSSRTARDILQFGAWESPNDFLLEGGSHIARL